MSNIGLPDNIKTLDDAYVQGIADGREQAVREISDIILAESVGTDWPEVEQSLNRILIKMEEVK